MVTSMHTYKLLGTILLDSTPYIYECYKKLYDSGMNSKFPAPVQHIYGSDSP